MEKSDLTEVIIGSYNSLSPQFYNELVMTLQKLDKDSQDATEMAKKFSELSEYKLMHESFLRKRAEETNKSASTIKIITIIYFVCSIISALFLADKFL